MREIIGNIFTTNADAIVNTINCVGVMGKGIALEFRNRFPQMYAEYRDLCRNGCIHPGEIWSYHDDASGQWILNFAVKDHWRHPSKYSWIEECLQNLPSICRRLGIKSLSVPVLGADNGWLPIKPCLQIMRKHLSCLNDVNVTVCFFDKRFIQHINNCDDNVFPSKKEILRHDDGAGVWQGYMDKARFLQLQRADVVAYNNDIQGWEINYQNIP